MAVAIELVGLPASGKSHVLQHADLGFDDLRVVPSGRYSFEKATNVLRGILNRPVVARLALADVVRSRPLKKVVFRWLILFERIGRCTTPVEVLDEGPLQAAWGLFSWRLRTPANVAMFAELVDALPAAEKLLCVSAGRDHETMTELRERTHPSYATLHDHELARDWMSVLLLQVRRGRKVVRYRNEILPASI